MDNDEIFRLPWLLKVKIKKICRKIHYTNVFAFFLVKLLWKQTNFLECTDIFYFDVKFLTSSVNVKNGMFLKPF